VNVLFGINASAEIGKVFDHLELIYNFKAILIELQRVDLDWKPSNTRTKFSTIRYSRFSETEENQIFI